MSNASRVYREVMNLRKDQSIVGMSLLPDEKNIRHLTAIIPGPVSSPYEGGMFHVDITLPGPSSLSIIISTYFCNFT